MLNDVSITVRRALASVALTAFQVAEVQQRRFERTFEEVKDRNQEVAQRQQVAANAHEQRVDVQRKAAEARRVAGASAESEALAPKAKKVPQAATASDPAPAAPAPEAPKTAENGQRGGSVDVKV